MAGTQKINKGLTQNDKLTDASVGSVGDGDAEIGRDEGFSSSRNFRRHSAEIITKKGGNIRKKLVMKKDFVS